MIKINPFNIAPGRPAASPGAGLDRGPLESIKWAPIKQRANESSDKFISSAVSRRESCTDGLGGLASGAVLGRSRAFSGVLARSRLFHKINSCKSGGGEGRRLYLGPAGLTRRTAPPPPGLLKPVGGAREQKARDAKH